MNVDSEEYFCSRGVTAYLETGMSPTESAVIPFHFYFYTVTIKFPFQVLWLKIALCYYHFGGEIVFLLGLNMALCGRKSKYNEKFISHVKNCRSGPSRAGVLAPRSSEPWPFLCSVQPSQGSVSQPAVPCGHLAGLRPAPEGVEQGKRGRRACFLFSDEASWKFSRTPPSCTSTDLDMHLTHQYLETREAVRPRLLVACKPSS